LIKLDRETGLISSVRARLKKLILKLGSGFRRLRGLKVAVIAKKIRKRLNNFKDAQSRNRVSIKAAAGQFIRRKTKGYLSEIYRVAALCESHKQRFRALEKKKIFI